MPGAQSLDARISDFGKIIFLGLACALLYHLIQGFFFGQTYPASTFLFRPAARFSDFFDFYQHSKSLNPYREIGPTAYRAYFPVAYILGYIFGILKPEASFIVVTTLALTSIFFSCATLLDQSKFEKTTWAIFLAVLCSYPFLFTLDRGNTEIVLLALLLRFVISFFQNKPVRCAFFLSLAVGMKLTPLIFIVLFIAHRRPKELVLTLFFSALFMAGAFEVFALQTGTSLLTQYSAMTTNQVLFTRTYSMTTEGTLFTHGLFTFFKFCLYAFDVPGAAALIQNALPIHTYISALVAMVTCSYVLWLEKTLWKQFAVLILTTLLLPHMSGDYKLILLLMPLLLLLKDPAQDSSTRIWIFWFGLIMIPKNYYRLSNLPEANLTVPINTLLMLGLLVAIMIEGAERKRLNKTL